MTSLDQTQKMAPGLFAGKYELIQQLGEGGMGVVHLAVHKALDQRVAIKLLHAAALSDPSSLERFNREGRLAAALKSEHVARVLDVGVTEHSEPYMVMEYLEGEDLQSYVRDRGPLSVGEAAQYVLQACEAIAEAHGQGIVHRDLKPANLFLTKRVDGRPLVKVLDFGISKLSAEAQQGQNVPLTLTRAVMGSPSYMSPEQLRSSRSADLRSDIWSLGVVLHELLTGRLPFHAETLTELTVKVVTEPAPAPSSIRPDLPRVIDAIIERCMQKDRERRYPSVAALARDLEPLLTAGPWTSVSARLERVSGLLPVDPKTAVAWADTRKGSVPLPAPRSAVPGIAVAVAGIVLVGAASLGAYAGWRWFTSRSTAAATEAVHAGPSAMPLPEDRTRLPVLPTSSAPASPVQNAPMSSATALPAATALPSLRAPLAGPPVRRAGGAAQTAIATATAAPAAPPSPPATTEPPRRVEPQGMPDERK